MHSLPKRFLLSLYSEASDLLVYLQNVRIHSIPSPLIAIRIIDCVVLGLDLVLSRINLRTRPLCLLLVLLQIRLKDRIVVVVVQAAVVQMVLLLRMVDPRGHVGEEFGFTARGHGERRQMEPGESESCRCCCVKGVKQGSRVLLGFPA